MFCRNTAAFNHRIPESVALRITSIPPSDKAWSRHSTTPTVNSVLLIETRGGPSSPNVGAFRVSFPNHPFSARNLADPTLQPDIWQRQPKSARSSHTIDSVTAKSIKNAVVQVASRGSRMPFTTRPPLPINPRIHSRGAETIPKIWISSPGLPGSILPRRPKYADHEPHPVVLTKPDSPTLQPQIVPVSAWSKSTESTKSIYLDERFSTRRSRHVSEGAINSTEQFLPSFRRKSSPGESPYQSTLERTAARSMGGEIFTEVPVADLLALPVRAVLPKVRMGVRGLMPTPF